MFLKGLIFPIADNVLNEIFILIICNMILTLILNKLKSFAFIIISLFKRALCCIKGRPSKCDVIPLTHVVSNNEDHLTDWGDWDNEKPNELKTMQDHIDLYRKRKFQPTKQTEPTECEEQDNFFENMTPHIVKQTKILINNDLLESVKNSVNRLNFVEDTVHVSSELAEWEDNSGWEADTLESDAQKMLRINKRLEREQRSLHQQQKRQERTLNRSLGSKLII